MLPIHSLRNFPVFLILVLNYSIAWSQTQSAQIKGRLLDQDQQPIVYSTVALYNLDSALVKGEVSNLEGYFQIDDITPGAYYVSSQNIEFVTFSSNQLNLVSDQIYDFGSIELSPRELELEGVTVTAKRQLVEVLPDRMIFNVSSTVNASGNNGLELLRKAPGVVVDPDNNVILQGKSGVRIFINGRPSRLSGNDLATLLESMQSDNIEQIELITNPSARYEAEGNAGIINIKLKNNINLGYSGNLIHSYSKGDEPRMSNGLTFNYGKGKLGISANATRFDNSFYEGFEDTKIQSGFDLRLKSTEIAKRSGYNLTTSITYDINKRHSVNLSGGGIMTDSHIDLISNTQIVNLNDPSADQLLLSESISDFTSSNYNYNLNYRWTVTEKSLFSADASYGSFTKDNSIFQPNTYFEQDGTTKIREVNNGFDPDTNIDLYSIKGDYEHSFKTVKLSAGAKYYKVNTENEFTVSDIVDGVSTVNPAKSNTFNYSEEVGAVYLIGDFKPTKSIKINAGLRVENTKSQGILESVQSTGNDNVEREYLNFFPNVSVAYSVGKSQFSLGYGRRITRPSYEDLNPFESKTSELVIWKGNPFLNPNYVTNYQFTYSFSNALVISNTYSITEGYFARLFEVVDETSSFIVPRNMRKTTTNGLSISYPLEISKWWETAGFFTYNRTTYNGEFDNADISISADIYNARLQNTFQLPLGITLNLTGYYSSPWIWRGSIEIDQYFGIEAGVRKDFFNEKLQIRLTGADIFNGASDYPYKGDYGGILINGIYSTDNRRFGFGLTYKFGNQKIKKQRSGGALDDQLNRI